MASCTLTLRNIELCTMELPPRHGQKFGYVCSQRRDTTAIKGLSQSIPCLLEMNCRSVCERVRPLTWYRSWRALLYCADFCRWLVWFFPRPSNYGNCGVYVADLGTGRFHSSSTTPRVHLLNCLVVSGILLQWIIFLRTLWQATWFT